MSSATDNRVTAKYLKLLGRSPESSPLMSSSKFNSSTYNSPNSPNKNRQQTLPDSDEENLSPIRKLIRERERGVRENGSILVQPKSLKLVLLLPNVKLHTGLNPPPKLQYVKPNLRQHSQAKEDRAALNRIVSGMSQSPSLKNLNKLKSIETKLKITKLKSSKLRSPKRSNTTIETGRKTARTSEYLQRIAEAKSWLEDTLKVEIDPEELDEKKIIVDFANYLRNGILLAELAKKFYPHSVKKIYYGTSPKVDYKSKSGFQFKYTENINYFFQMLEEMNLPTDYRFELTDLYDLKNFPKVIFCLHAVAYMLATQRKCSRMSHEDREIEFSEQDLARTESSIRGLKIPNFDNFDDIDADTSIEESSHEASADEISIPKTPPRLPSPVLERTESPILKISAVEEAEEEVQQDDNDDVFLSDVEVKFEQNSVIEIPSETEDDDPFGFLATVENIHKKYESMIEQDIRNSPTKSICNSSKEDLFASPTKSIYDSPSRSLFDSSTKSVFDSPTDKIETNFPSLEMNTLSASYQIRHSPELFEKFDSPTKRPVSPTKISYSEYSANLGEELTLYLDVIIKLQAVARGSLYRYQMFVDKFTLKTCRDQVSQLLAILRGNLLRTKIANLKKDLTFHSGGIQKIQSFLKFNKNDEKFFKISGQLLFHKDAVIKLQSVLRSYLVKERLSSIRKRLLEATNEIIKLQSHIRFKAIKNLTSLKMNRIEIASPYIIMLQAVIRTKLFRDLAKREQNEDEVELVLSPDADIIVIQSIIRGNNVRQLYKLLHRALSKNINSLTDFQSTARGGISRNRLNYVLDTLYYQDIPLCRLSAIARGNLLRNSIKTQKKNLQKELNSIIAVQSCFRGVFSRFEQDFIWDELEDSIELIISFQSIWRGQHLRKSLKARWAYYNEPANVQKIIKIQSYIRSRNQGTAYKSLTTMETPPLVAIKKFIGLLNESEMEFDAEISLSKTKELIKKTTAQILKLEEELDHLDVKIEMLTKNKITIDELATYKNHPHSKSTLPSENEPKSNVPKSTREKIELYGKIVYLLQTRSGYFIRLFDVIEKHNFRYDIGINENIEDFILRMFGYSLNQENKKVLSREEFLVVSLILESIYSSINSCKSIDDYKDWSRSEATLKGLTNNRFGWEMLLVGFDNLVEQRTLMKELFCHNVETIIIDDEIDFESHPILIYRSIIEAEEKKTGNPSRKSSDITAQEAIQDTLTREKFVTNLGNLREISNELLEAIENSIDKLPMHIRVLCKGVFKFSCKKFPKVSERSHLSVVGKIFMKYYFLPILLRPENYGISLLHTMSNERDASKVKKNLCEIAKVLYQLITMKVFGAKNVYLQPLNDYVEQSTESVHRLLKKLIDVKDLEVAYNMNVYDDIVCDPKPAIMITADDCKLLTRMLTKEIDIMAPSRGDVLRNFVSDLNSIPGDPFKSLGQVRLELIPVAEEEEQSSAETRKLFLEAKRCVMYLIQVQNGDNLVDLLVSHIEPQHENLFKQLIMQEKKDLTTKHIQQPYSGGLLTIESYDPKIERQVLHDLTTLSYHDLKRITLEKLLELERLGEVTRQDGFQKLLNEMATDIKEKHTHTLQIKRESEKASETLSKLRSKKNTLQRQLDNYNNEIEQAIGSLHSSSSSKKKGFFSKIFSRQFYYQRELKKSGRLPKFGSYKYTAKYLHDNGILIEVKGMASVEHELSSSGSSKIPKVDFSFSCDKVGIFEIEMRNGTSIMGGALEKITLDDLLELQYKDKKTITMFKGIAKFSVDALMAFLFRKFYDKH